MNVCRVGTDASGFNTYLRTEISTVNIYFRPHIATAFELFKTDCDPKLHLLWRN